MVSVLPAHPFTYVVLSECRRDRRAAAVHEPNPAERSGRTSSTRITAPPRSPYPSKGLLAQYGDRLICVRYRYDEIVGLRVAFAEAAVRDRVTQAGGTWNPEQRVWQLRYDRVVDLGLSRRIVDARHPIVDTRSRAASIQMQIPRRHLDEDACVYHWMLASNGRCQGPLSNSSSAARFSDAR